MKPSQLLDKPEKWIKGSLARTADGNSIYPESLAAVSWCLGGCLIRLYPTKTCEELAELAGFPSWGKLVDYNNAPERTFADVRAKLLEAGL